MTTESEVACVTCIRPDSLAATDAVSATTGTTSITTTTTITTTSIHRPQSYYLLPRYFCVLRHCLMFFTQLKTVFVTAFKKTNAYAQLLAGARNAVPGERAYPKIGKREDERLGLRLEYGERVQDAGTDVRMIVARPNRGAVHVGLRKLAVRRPREVLFKVPLNLKSPPGRDAFVSAMEEVARKWV
ncbi:hypothetical protein BV25DRAFT_1920373 [Artomyces pyxidatus]|uniref:Uncharacterized protein n=1 Tax=Artomyces pyxidatus TaxID=48021 RepID=A0ACB8SMQ5_9AGAM|nr:hypothetical protein BV25DRAFT_1920373 [Artomyces pyxidatus]